MYFTKDILAEMCQMTTHESVVLSGASLRKGYQV